MLLRSYSLAILLFVIATPAYTQQHTISGYIMDADTGEKLIGANVSISGTTSGTTSNDFGFFSITPSTDSLKLEISYVGYEPQEIALLLDQDTSLNISLQSSAQLTTVEVTSDRVERIEENVQMSRIDVPVDQIKKIPALLGEVDVIKAIQLLPGVQSGGEGQTGIYVRGGSPDQNLILLDGVPVYSISHLGGLFSVFNADAIKNVNLIKGGFPARFGGRLSSVLQVSMKDGNNQTFKGEGSIGLITSKLTLEGPINRGKTSFIVSGRRTYLDLFAKPVAKSAARQDGSEIKPKLHFYDLNAKVNHTFNDRHRLYLSAYSGADVFYTNVKEENTDFGGGLDWGNWISAARWNWKIAPKVFSNTTLIFSDYKFNAGVEYTEYFGNETSNYKSKYLSGIRDFGFKWDLDWIPSPTHYLRFGAGMTNHKYNPGALTFKASDFDFILDTLIGTAASQSQEYYLYAEDEVDLGRLKLNMGVHASAFNVENTFYHSVQPRISARYALRDRLSLKGSFNTMTQYINLLTTEALSLPTDLWVPSTDQVLPQRAWQVALGAAKSYQNLEVSLEAYYKKMDNVVSLRPGSNFLFGLDNKWEQKITQGSAETYGAEFLLQKKSGKTTGWLGYTLSWNQRKFDDINSGHTFPFRYDRRHDLSIVINHDFNDRISLSGSWVYGTGNAVSLPFEKFHLAESPNGFLSNRHEIQQFEAKNSFRMSDYHRLDLGIQFSKKKKRHTRTWSFGAYNTYFHNNPYFIYSSQKYEWDPVREMGINKTIFKEVSIIPIIVPYISYGFKF